MAYAQTASPNSAKFAQALRGVGPAGIPVAVPDGIRPWLTRVADHYTIEIVQFQDQIHPTLGPTTLWGFNPTTALGVTGSVMPRHLGGIIVAEKGRPVQITFRNKLPNAHILPVDTTIMGAEPDQAQNRTSVHLHGGEVPWISDGNPFSWWDPQGGQGVNFIGNQVLRPGQVVPGNEAEYYYPNNQSARMAWYHDHALGITRLNAHAGIASAYIIRDNFERSLVSLGLPNFIELGGRELPIVIQDKTFLQAEDPNYPGSAKSAGSLFYPYSYDPADQGPHTKDLPEISCVPETFGDTMLVNGTVWPVASIAPRRHRLRILNACQAMFLNLQLYEADASGNPVLTRPGPDALVIGTEGGFLALPTVVRLGKAFDPLTRRSSLMTAPGERWDVLIDFNGLAGRKLVLCNDAPAPFPGGVQPTGDTRVLMRFDVGPERTAGPADKPLRLPANLAGAAASGIPAPLAVIGKTFNWSRVTTEPIKPPAGVTVRALTLNEGFDDYGRLIQRLGTNVPTAPGDFARSYVPDPMNVTTPDPDDPTEVAANNAEEVWQIFNLTMDAHPMHFHLVNVQLLSRQAFDTAAYLATPVNTRAVATLLGRPHGPEASEIGWKETVKMYPGEVTTVIMKLALPVVPFVVPPSPRTGANEYVWHCHILEHEEHDMMRPLLVTGPNPVG